MESDLYDEDHELFREVVREYVTREVVPNLERWEREHLVDRTAWLAAGKQGLVGLAIAEEFAAVGAASLHSGFSLNEDVALPYLLDLANEEQKARWLPGFSTGETIAAIAMTEPGAGSDLKGIRTSAVRDGDYWVIKGS